MSNPISIKVLQSGADYIAKFSRIKLTVNQLRELIAGTPVEKYVRKYRGFDTAEREMCMDLIAQKLLGVDWPCNFERQGGKNTLIEILVKAQEADYELILSVDDRKALHEYIASRKAMQELTEQAQDLKMGY